MNQHLKRFLMRRKYLVNRELQVKLLTRSVMAACVMFVVMGLTLFLPLILSLQTVDSESEAQADAAVLFLSLNDRFLPVALLTIFAAALCSLRSSHKIAGPLYRITDTLRRIGTGVLPVKVTTRTGDFLDPEVAVLNEMLEGLRESAIAIHSAKADLLAEVSVADGRPIDPASVKARVMELDTALEGFRIDSATPTESEQPEAAKKPEPQQQRGFTLLELMIVVSVIAIIATIAVPRYFHAVRNARTIKAIAGIRLIISDIEIYRTRHGRLPDTLPRERMDPWGNPYQYVNFDLLDDDEDTGNGGDGGDGKDKKEKVKKPKRKTKVPKKVKDKRAKDKKAKEKDKKDKQAKEDAGEEPDDPSDEDEDPWEEEYEEEEDVPPLNTDYDLYSLGPDEATGESMDDPESQDDVIRGNDGMFIGRASAY